MKTPYYAVIFTSVTNKNISGYAEMTEKIEVLARQQPGFLGVESAREEVGITVSYWKDLGSIKRWKSNRDHLIAQQKGKESWYKNYTIRITKVEHEYGTEW